MNSEEKEKYGIHRKDPRFSGEDQNNSEMINNIVNLTSSYTELVDNLDSGSVPRPLTALSV